MATYQVWLVKYNEKDKKRYGVMTFDNIIPVAQIGMAIQSIDKAREVAYKGVAHSGLNAGGTVKAVIYANGFLTLNDRNPYLVGELLNNVWDERYWYPSNDGVYCGGGKYVVYKNGKLGKRLR